MTNKITNQEFMELVRNNVAFIATQLALTPRIYGDPRRVEFNGAGTNDVLINVLSGTVKVAKDVFFGHGCQLLTGTHDIKKFGQERVDSYPRDGRDIVIEEGVWVASGAIVLGPCIIGKHAVVSAGSIVRGNLDAYGIYAGSPAVKVGEIPEQYRA